MLPAASRVSPQKAGSPRSRARAGSSIPQLLAEKQRRGFSRGFLLCGFHCCASSCPHNKAFPKAASATGVSSAPHTRWYFHTYTSPHLGLGPPAHPAMPSRAGAGTALPPVPREPHLHPSSSEEPLCPCDCSPVPWSPTKQRPQRESQQPCAARDCTCGAGAAPSASDFATS